MQLDKDNNLSNLNFYQQIANYLSNLYTLELKPLEEKVNYYEKPLDCARFGNKPIILVIGSYSSGKTSFIEYLLNEKFTFTKIGPQPSTDCFDVISYGEQRSDISGISAVTDKRYPFSNLSKYPDSFKNRFKIHEYKNRLLESVTFIDTPGIISQTDSLRQYDNTKVFKDLFEISAKIIFMIDIEKIEITKDMREILLMLINDFPNKFIFVVNKCHHLVTFKNAVDLFASIAWQICLAIGQADMPRFYCISSCHFYSDPTQEINRNSSFRKALKDMLVEQTNSLMEEFINLQKQHQIQCIEDMTKRCKMLKFYIDLCVNLRSNYVSIIRNEKTIRRQISDNLDNEIRRTCTKSKGSIFHSDFYNISHLREHLQSSSSSKLAQATKPKYLQKIAAVLDELSNLRDRLREGAPEDLKNILNAFLNFPNCQQSTNPFAMDENDNVQLSNRTSSLMTIKQSPSDQNDTNENESKIDRFLRAFRAHIDDHDDERSMLPDKLIQAITYLWPNHEIDRRTLALIWNLVFESTQSEDLRGSEFVLICLCIERVLSGKALPKSIAQDTMTKIDRFVNSWWKNIENININRS